MHLSDETKRKRKALPQSLQAVLHRRDVVRDLRDVVDRHVRDLVALEQEQIGQRGLRALDLRRQQRFLAHVHIEKQWGRRQDGRHAVEPPDGATGGVVEGEQALQVERRGRRKRRGQKCPHPLAAGSGLDELAQSA